MADPRPKVDAILCPAQYPGHLDERARHLHRNREFGAVLGAKRVHSSHAPGGLAFVRADPELAMFHGRDHPLSGQDRYEWEDRGDGVLYGALIAPPQGESPEQRSAALQAARKETLKSRLAEIEAIAAAARTPNQQAELERTRAWLQRLYGE